MVKEEDVIREFLGERPEAAQLRDWRETLEYRLRSLEAELARAAPEQRPAIESRLQPLRKQIAALRQEEAVTTFVEDSVRATLHLGAVSGTDEEY
jgi:predicted trehalose synthase